ncbi:hypothetical protein WH47_03806 [Habropoda laboriosa]|uniref:Uncharacterized protein n=1 Tax=Habropoda laboriosa TaxID=597456 RepID=A0A0L7QUU0_9HYME|nr:hypothetical protein WH47_03806 [Habropoda laboriosa]
MVAPPEVLLLARNKDVLHLVTLPPWSWLPRKPCARNVAVSNVLVGDFNSYFENGPTGPSTSRSTPLLEYSDFTTCLQRS